MLKKTKSSEHDLKILVKKQSLEIEEYKKKLQKITNEINDELKMAKDLQESLMPTNIPDFINTKISAVYIPAGKVGGDFYDIIITSNQKLAILIFDVSGHGVSAALIGAMAKMLFAHFIETQNSPSMIFRELNKKLCSFIKTEHYLTAFLGILDPIQNHMIYSRAGHVKPIVYHTAEKKISLLDERGFFIGHSALVDIAKYSQGEITFHPDDKLILYTDGLTEGCNQNNDLYGTERLKKVIHTNGYLPIEELVNTILEDQAKFRNGQQLRDDFTILCLKIGNAYQILKESGFTQNDSPVVQLIYKKPEIENVCLTILRAMDNCGFSDIEIKRTKICIFEMLINAFEHGNKNDPQKKIIVLYKVNKDKIIISIVDEGEGFDYRNLPNPLDKENMLKDHGRGVFIVTKYMDEVLFNERGNRILVVKNHEGENNNGDQCLTKK